MKLRPLVILLMLLLWLPAGGVGGYSRPVKVLQPDGGLLVLRIYGDESFSYKTTLDGSIVAQGEDGFYYYADYNSGKLNISSRRVSSEGEEGYAKTIPTMVFQSLASSKNRQLSRFGQFPVLTRAVTSFSTLVIPVQFADEKFITPSPRNRIFNLFNQVNYSADGATGSVRDYFRDNTGITGNLTFDIVEPVTLSECVAYYGANTSEMTDARIRHMVVEACMAADHQGVDFSKYDYDSDGVVDNVFIIYAGHNEAEGGGDAAIWPQSWNVADMKLYIDGKRILNFSCCSELSGAYGLNFTGIGTICHEYCHYFGLKDMYDINSDTEGLSNGLFGTLSIMDKGCYNNEGKTPPYFNIVEREMLGLAGKSFIMNEGTILLPPVRDASEAKVLRTSYNDELFFLEYRDGNGWDKYAGGVGLVIYHVDRTDNDAGSMSARMRWKTNTVNGCASHPCARAVTPPSLASPVVGDAFFPGTGGINDIHSSETFALLDWSGRGVGFGLSDIRGEADKLAVDIIDDNSWDLPSVTSYSVITRQTSATLSWEASGSRDGEWYLIWKKSTAVSADTLVTKSLEYDFNFLTPDCEYMCEIYYLYHDVKSKSYSFSFHTAKMLSSFPLIGGIKKEYEAGETIPLYVFNLVEDYQYIRWYLGSDIIEGDKLIVQVGGKYELSAEITYPDFSVERLSKTIIIKEK